MSNEPAVFIFESPNAGDYINKFNQAGYKPFYNTRNGKDYQWFMKNFFGSVHRMYNSFIDKEQQNLGHALPPSVTWRLIDYTTSDLLEDMRFSPEIIIIFGEHVVMNDLDWEAILVYIKNIIRGSGGDELFLKRGAELMIKPIIQRIETEEPKGEFVNVHGLEGFLTSIKPEYPKLDKPYEVRTQHIDAVKKDGKVVVPDIMVYEVSKPGVLEPFTVVIHDHETHGVKRLFTDIYGSKKWDSSRKEGMFDFLFLQALWKHCGLEGEFTTLLVKDRADRCYPGRCICLPVETRHQYDEKLKKIVYDECPTGKCISREVDTEPRVYRRSLENVVRSIIHNQPRIESSDLPEHLTKRRRI